VGYAAGPSARRAGGTFSAGLRILNRVRSGKAAFEDRWSVATVRERLTEAEDVKAVYVVMHQDVPVPPDRAG
jgi:hypothetical protein